MKKVISIILSTVMMLTISASVFAANGDIVGHIYSTDILAYVNDKPIESYNIGGKTAIIMEDLATGEVNYGFDVWYEDESRKLTVNSKAYSGYGECDVKRGTVGKITGKIYETDIKVVFNAKEVQGYNIGGKTAVCIEDLGAVTEDSKNYTYGYSDYMCNFTWDNDTRTVKLNTFLSTVESVADYIAPKVELTYTDDVLSLSFDQLNSHRRIADTIAYSDEILADTYRIKPLYLNGEEIGLMYMTWNGRCYSKLDKHKIHKASKKISDVLSYDEALSFIEGNFNIIDTRENENAKFFLADNKETGFRYLLAAQKTKGLLVRNADPKATLKEDENGITFLSSYTAGPPGSGIVQVTEYFMDEEFDFDGYIKNYENSLTEEEIRLLNSQNEELNYKIHLTDRKEQTKDCEGKFSIKYTPDNIFKSGDAEYFSSSIHSNGNVYEIIFDFSDGQYSSNLIDLFRTVSSGNQALPIHNEEGKYDLVNEKIRVMINGKTAEKVAVKTVSWKGETTVYMYVRDIQPISIKEIEEINITVNE